MNECKYCRSFISSNIAGAWEQTILETDNFVVVPTLGSIVPGWVLIVPKLHILNMAEISSSYELELEHLLTESREFLTSCFGEPILFEHGPSRAGSLSGCGIDHAHLHMVSLELDIQREFENSQFAGLSWSCLGKNILPSQLLMPHGMDYLYFQNTNRGAFIAEVECPTSQFFRKVIARGIGLPDHFDYKQYSFLENAMLTQQASKQFFANKIGNSFVAAA